MHPKLQILLEMAQKDETLKMTLLSTRESNEPMDALCAAAGKAGVDVGVDELLRFGVAHTEELLRSTNGGATDPFDYLEDVTELFYAALEMGGKKHE